MQVCILKVDGEVVVAFNSDVIDIDELGNLDEFEVEEVDLTSDLDEVLEIVNYGRD